MKKYIVSFLLIATFAVYAVYLKFNGTNTGVYVSSAPASVSSAVPVNAPPVTTVNSGQYKDGQYTGTSVNSYYGNIQVAVTISSGAISDIQFLSYPNDRGTSVRINNQAMPILKQEAITAQSANVDTVSGATDSSGAFRQSLGSALAQAVNS